MNCLNCIKETHNPKFCSTSCSVSFNNKNRPKRKLVERFCNSCGKSLGAVLSLGRRSRCEECRHERDDRIDWSTITKGQLRSRGVGNNSNNSCISQIRQKARQWYKESGRPQSCLNCSYDKHFEVCHIVDIKDQPDDALVKDINSSMNTIALCPNCHWEFDRGMIQRLVSDTGLYAYEKRLSGLVTVLL